jgi:hypothetical protein
MPTFLKLMTFVSLFGILAVLVPLLPITKFTIDGQEITWIQAWKTGLAPMSVVIGLLLVTSAYCFTMRIPQGRWIFIAAMLLSNFQDVRNLEAGVLPASIICLGFIVWYLFGKKTVRQYFLQERKIASNNALDRTG